VCAIAGISADWFLVVGVPFYDETTCG